MRDVPVQVYRRYYLWIFIMFGQKGLSFIAWPKPDPGFESAARLSAPLCRTRYGRCCVTMPSRVYRYRRNIGIVIVTSAKNRLPSSTGFSHDRLYFIPEINKMSWKDAFWRCEGRWSKFDEHFKSWFFPSLLAISMQIKTSKIKTKLGPSIFFNLNTNFSAKVKY